MTGILKVDQWKDSGDNTLMTSDGAGVLTANAGITIPSGATITNNGTASGFGKIGQVLYTSYSTSVTNSTTSYVDTGLTLNITPSATSSKILVYVSQHMFIEDGTSNGTSGALQLNGSISGMIAIGNIGRRYPDTIQQMEQVPLYYLDSPNTTSAVTYKTQFKLQSGSSIVCQRNSEPSMITLMEVLA
jgi:hypothetical protein